MPKDNPTGVRTARSELTTGTVTFLFSDIEGSTRLVQELRDRFREVLEEHQRIMRAALARHDGREVSTEGDSFFAVFPSAPQAVAAAAEIQRDHASHQFPAGASVKVRIGLHTGTARLGGDNYVGLDVHRGARIAAASHGGEVLVSDATRALAASELPAGVALRDLGERRLKDLDVPERLFRLVVEGLPDDFPPPRSIDAIVGNLPPALTSFIGRQPEVDTLSELLRRTRLLTLTGPGGTGKTRLGLEAARHAAGDFTDGVFFVALDAIREPALVASAIAQTLGVREAGRSTEEALADHLAARRLLLVLDNFEQILPAASLVDRLLSAAQQLHVLVTSRVPLGLYGEQEYQVAPLRLPDRAVLRAGAPLSGLSQYEAVALFIERAQAVSPSFSVTNENASAVVEICIRLDGLPLAIELAAARIKLLSPDAILARLGRRLDLLTSQSPNLPPRQRTLRGAIAWSWELLDEREQKLFERLSVFSGGWDLAAGAAVCPPGELGVDLLDGLASLLDKSLVARVEAAEPRFTMLQTIREYAQDRLLARGEDQLVARRHAIHFRDLAEAAEPEFVGPDPRRAVTRLAPEQDNFRAAMAWAIEADAADIGLRLASAIWRFWEERGQLREGRDWLDRLLALPSVGDRTLLRARGLTAAGGIAYWQGDEAMRRYYDEALAIYREHDDAQGIADSLQNLAFATVTTATGPADAETAMELFRDSLARYRELNDQRNIASVVGAIGFGDLMVGHYDTARPALEEALRLNLALGLRGRANDHRWVLAHLDRLTGNLAAAAANYRAALLEARETLDAGRVLMQLATIGPYATVAGRHRDAVRLAGAIERAREEQGGMIGAGGVPGLTDPVEEARAANALTESEIADALAAGRGMDLGEAVDFALALLEEEAQSGTRR